MRSAPANTKTVIQGRGASSGFTLLELMLVLGLVALLTGSVVVGFRSFAKSELRGSSTKLAGAIRYLFDRASTTGKIHRLVFDFQEGKYWAEVSDDRFFIPRERETEESRVKAEEAIAKEEEEKKEAEARGESVGGEADEMMIDPSRYQPTEWKSKRARFEMFQEKALKVVTLKNAKLAGLFTPRYAQPVSTGKGFLYFFPLGQTEPAVVHLSDEDGETFYSLLVHPLNGRVKVQAGYVAPRVEQQFDDEGNESRRHNEAACPTRRLPGGFTLLEVMVALAILALSLVVLVGIATDNVRNTHHAKMTTVATFLARAKMAELEDLVLEEGFVDSDQEEEGDFADDERPEFRWKTFIQKMELPADLAQQTQDMTAQATEANSDNPLAAMAGFMGGFMTTLIEPIRVGLEEAVRRVTVQVYWDEVGRPQQTFEVVTFMTDPAKLDMAVQAIGQPPGGSGAQGQGQQGQGQQGQGGGGTGTGTGTGGGSRSSGTGTGTGTGTGQDGDGDWGAAVTGGGSTRCRPAGAGFTLLEVMLALAILGFITTILLGTFNQTNTIRTRTQAVQERSHAARVALMRLSRELEMAFLSDSENPAIAERRTMFISEPQRDVDELRFSWFGRQRLRGDVPESDTSVIMYYAEPDPDDRSVVNLMRRETRRLEAADPRSVPGESYILCPNISRLKFTFYDFKKPEWREDWTTTGTDGFQYLPTHVRIALTIYDERGREQTFTSSARIMMTERVGYRPGRS